MRNLLYLVLSLVFLTNCAQSDGGNSPYYKNVSGVWVLASAISPNAVSVNSDGYIVSEKLKVVGTKPFSQFPTKLFLTFDSVGKKLTVSTFIQENGKKVSSVETLEFSITNTDVVIPAAESWNMIKLNDSQLNLRSAREILIFKKASAEILAAETGPATFSLAIGDEDKAPSFFFRRVSHTGTAGLVNDPEIQCSINEEKELNVTIPNYFKLHVAGFAASADAKYSQHDMELPAKIHAVYTEPQGEEEVSVSGGLCKLDSLFVSGKMKLSFACANAEGTSSRFHSDPGAIEKVNMSGAVLCRLDKSPSVSESR